MGQAVQKYEAGGIPVNAPAALVSGEVVVYSTGRIYVYEGLTAVASGDPVWLADAGVKEMTALSTDTGSIDTVVYWDDGNNRITTTAGANSRAGRLARAKTNGETTALVNLNVI